MPAANRAAAADDLPVPVRRGDAAARRRIGAAPYNRLGYLLSELSGHILKESAKENSPIRAVIWTVLSAVIFPAA